MGTEENDILTCEPFELFVMNNSNKDMARYRSYNVFLIYGEDKYGAEGEVILMLWFPPFGTTGISLIIVCIIHRE